MEESSNPDATHGGFLQLPSVRFIQSPISSLLEYSGVLRRDPPPESSSGSPLVAQSSSTTEAAANGAPESGSRDSGDGNNEGDVSIRIVGESGAGDGGDNVNDDYYYRGSSRFLQQAARWVEQILPFSVLFLVVFIRQHLQGFLVIGYAMAVLVKSDDVLQNQTALKGERKLIVLLGCSMLFMIHIFGIYWWLRNDDVLYSLLMIPPTAIPHFWRAVFIILLNDIMVRQAGMIFKLVLLMFYKNGRAQDFRRRGQMLTLVEYILLLHRTVLPTPLWYRFFLNQNYGSFFSSVTAGLYLTFKLASIVEKVKSLVAAVKALSRKEVPYGAYATQEQVNNAAGDFCAICQEKMHAPILLSCNHMFCEDCISEWFDRERTCPLCRALVRPADLQSFGDGSTSLFFQVF
ncbi:uncharacterized protein LOC127256357 [Andrographis paniculata]|uniref:uncharacterized protein LOC127256357 n=1 Tax=Andrographis paniculata TaxID=175694 RepID=UPI0021E94939|nr:uncharacterized protein LOC127256357 [Andrographis paniculata]